MNRITVRIDDLINQLNEIKRDGAEKVLLEIEEGVAEPEENCPNRINLMSAYHLSDFGQKYLKVTKKQKSIPDYRNK
ncbi:MAG: hypothetical protein ACLR1I_11400 [Ruminococcus sp.]